MVKKTRTVSEILDGIDWSKLRHEDKDAIEFEVWQAKEGDKTRGKRWFTSEARRFDKDAKRILDGRAMREHSAVFEPRSLKPGDRFYDFVKTEWEAEESTRKYALYLQDKANIYREVSKRL